MCKRAENHMEVIENELRVLFVGSAADLVRMGGIQCAFPDISLHLRSTGFFVPGREAETNRRCVVLALDDGQDDFITSLKNCLADCEPHLTDIIVSKSFNDYSTERDFYIRWESHDVYPGFNIFSSTRYDIDHDLEFSLRRTFVHFSRRGNISHQQNYCLEKSSPAKGFLDYIINLGMRFNRAIRRCLGSSPFVK